MENINPSLENNQAKKITTMVIVLIVVGLLVFMTYQLSRKKNKEPETTNINNLTETSSDGFPTTFYSYVGTIQKIEGGKIEIMAPAAKNYLTADTTITIETDEQTNFYQQDKNMDINQIQPGASGEFYKTTVISLTDLKVGQEITAIDHDNVRGKTEFNAKRIEVNATEK